MSTFSSSYASIYDALYAEKPYAAETEWILHKAFSVLAPRASRLVVYDFACGTGRHLYEFAQLGHEIHGSDISPFMIAMAKARIPNAAALSVTPMQQCLAPKSTDLALCLFDAIGYLPSLTDIRTTLSSLSLHKGALLVLEYWHSSAVLTGIDPLRVKEFRNSEISGLRISRSMATSSDTVRIEYDYFSTRDDSTYTRHKEVHDMRHFSQATLNGLMAESDFRIIGNYDGFSDALASQDTWHVVSLAEKI
jgi:SAM-dependent methyltransferase